MSEVWPEPDKEVGNDDDDGMLEPLGRSRRRRGLTRPLPDSPSAEEIEEIKRRAVDPDENDSGIELD